MAAKGPQVQYLCFLMLNVKYWTISIAYNSRHILFVVMLAKLIKRATLFESFYYCRKRIGSAHMLHIVNDEEPYLGHPSQCNIFSRKEL